MEMQKPRRAPALERFVSEIRKEDIRVRVFGTVKDSKGGLFTLEDSSGKILVDSKDSQAKKGQKIIVFGRPIDNAGKLELQAEIVKDASGMDENLYKKAHLVLAQGATK
ncbi:TPA: replication protein RepA [archaeon]|nr:replication protein RepA [Candidatus Naiadarchaeales archaeon SRR2090159.bin1288]